MAKHKRILVTSALPYANGPIHIGHLAGAYLPADIYVRYCRLKKRDVVYICGSDENGVPIMLKARAEGKDPQEIVDRYHTMIKKAFDGVGMTFDFYGRTSSPVHHETSRDFFRALAQKNQFTLKKERQLYDPEAKLFLADRFVYGTCPSCGHDKAYGDQCEKCGTSLSPKELIDPKSTITDTPPIEKETTHWYLPLEKLQPMLENWINEKTDWKPNVLGQVRSWLNDGLRDRAVTRDLPWGITVPEDVAEQEGVDASGKKLYVWFDAPIGYISATKEWATERGQPDLWKEYWQNEDTKLLHFIGKDNIVFHCLIFPAMLAIHDDFVLPENVPANEFLNIEGAKLSTSRNHAVWLHEYLETFEPDSLRYALSLNFPETRDADFSWKEFQARHNNELADVLGNFINRAFTFIHRYFDGELPEIGELAEIDEALLTQTAALRDEVGEAIDAFRFKEATKKMMALARAANKYFNDSEPWKSRKENPEQCATTLNLCAQTAHALAILSSPIIPFTSDKIWQMLQLEGSAKDASWSEIGTSPLPAGHRIGELSILFKKIEDSEIVKEMEKLGGVVEKKPAEKNTAKPQPIENHQITIDDFAKVQLRVAEIVAAEPVKGADRLLKLQVKIGEKTRQIVAGIAQHYSPDELPGKNVVVVANLKPAKLRGEISEGMILAAVDKKTGLTLVTPEKIIPSGSIVR